MKWHSPVTQSMTRTFIVKRGNKKEPFRTLLEQILFWVWAVFQYAHMCVLPVQFQFKIAENAQMCSCSAHSIEGTLIMTCVCLVQP